MREMPKQLNLMPPHTHNAKTTPNVVPLIAAHTAAYWRTSTRGPGAVTSTGGVHLRQGRRGVARQDRVQEVHEGEDAARPVQPRLRKHGQPRRGLLSRVVAHLRRL